MYGEVDDEAESVALALVASDKSIAVPKTKIVFRITIICVIWIQSVLRVKN